MPNLIWFYPGRDQLLFQGQLVKLQDIGLLVKDFACSHWLWRSLDFSSSVYGVVLGECFAGRYCFPHFTLLNLGVASHLLPWQALLGYAGNINRQQQSVGVFEGLSEPDLIVVTNFTVEDNSHENRWRGRCVRVPWPSSEVLAASVGQTPYWHWFAAISV